VDRGGAIVRDTSLHLWCNRGKSGLDPVIRKGFYARVDTACSPRGAPTAGTIRPVLPVRGYVLFILLRTSLTAAASDALNGAERLANSTFHIISLPPPVPLV
jgi:hypothetical protein